LRKRIGKARLQFGQGKQSSTLVFNFIKIFSSDSYRISSGPPKGILFTQVPFNFQENEKTNM